MEENTKKYDDFLKSLRVAITNTSVYFQEHPIFVKAIQDLKQKTDQVLAFFSPLKITVTPDSLILGEDILKDSRLYEDVANFFHLRKVKNIEIKPGVTFKDLALFLTQANTSLENILRKGGLNNILKEEGISAISVGDLDYSQLLKGEGQECKDIWLFLAKDTLAKDDYGKMMELADNFKEILVKLNIDDLTENNDIREIVDKFLSYLKKNNKNKFFECSRGLAKTILKSQEVSKEKNLEKIKKFLEDLSADDISSILLEQLEGSQSADALSFNLFAQLVDKKKHEGVAASLAEKIKKDQGLLNNEKVVSGIRELMSLPTSGYISQIYSSNLSEMIKKISTPLKKELYFDQKHLKDNYRYILLDIFLFEKDKKRLKLVLDKILVELDEAFESNNLDYIKKFLDILDKKRSQSPTLDSVFSQADKRISSFVEKAIFEEETSLDLDYFVRMLKSSSLDAKYYIEKIFNEKKINSYILTLFFKFFPQEVHYFCENVTRNIANIPFIKRIMDNLDNVKGAYSVKILEHIYFSANNFIKLEVLKKMRELSLCHGSFLINIVKKGDFLQRKEALNVISKHKEVAKEAAQVLLDITNPLGIRSRLIEDNLKLIDEVPLVQAKDYLIGLSNYRFFWNRRVRMAAKNILNKHYE